MGMVGSAMFEILNKPTIWDVFAELTIFMAPLWLAVVVGVLVGWAWRPKWVSLVRELFVFSMPATGLSSMVKQSSLFSSLSEKDLQTFTDFATCFNSLKMQLPSCISWISDDGFAKDISLTECSSQVDREKSSFVTEDDLEHLCRLVEIKDGGPSWIQMMERSTPTMHYQAWRRDPETGPPQYRSSTIYEDATPEQLRDFFWDDEFRAHWDDMLIHASTLEECPTNGAMLVHWVRKFPFFDREYVIGRRIWESGRSYYCITKGVPCSSIPRRNKPRRVDLYYSSWCIRSVESKRGTGSLTACEVLLFHHEDMGIPREIAKFGIRQGMWGAVKKIEPGLRAYQRHRSSESPLSRSAFMAQINTKVNADYLRYLETSNDDTNEASTSESCEKPMERNIPKLLVVGGAIVLACSLDRGLLTKAVIFGVARKFAKIGGSKGRILSQVVRSAMDAHKKGEIEEQNLIGTWSNLVFESHLLI